MENNILLIIVGLSEIILVIFMFWIKNSITHKHNIALNKHKKLLEKELEDYKYKKDTDFKIYSELINLTRPYLDDPTLTYEEALNMAKLFIIKYNNEILPFASKELVSSVDNFLYNSATKIAWDNKLISSLWNMISSIRKEQWLEQINDIKIHIVDTDYLKKKYQKLSTESSYTNSSSH